MDENRCEGAEHREPTAPSVDGLIARLERANEGSWELDYEIMKLAFPKIKFRYEPAMPAVLMGACIMGTTESGLDEKVRLTHYTRSLDDALTLVPEGWFWNVGRASGLNGKPYTFSADLSCDTASTDECFAPSPALALCIATLKARQTSPPETTSAAPPSPPAVVDYTTPDAPTSSAEKIRECTCHPDDNPPQPCPRKFAYSECVKAALLARLREPDEEMVKAVAVAMCEAWFYCGVETPDGAAQWRKTEAENTKKARAVLAVITEKLT